jgi:hypothetical protein
VAVILIQQLELILIQIRLPLYVSRSNQINKMKSSNHVLATTILIGNAVYTESFQASVPFIQKRSLPATLRSTLNEPTINLSTIRMHRSSNLHSTSKQSNEIDLKTQEKEESTDKNDNNPLNEVMASFPPFNFDLDKFMASMPFKFDDQSDEVSSFY